MPCIPKPNPCQDLPVYPNNQSVCKDEQLQRIVLPTINGQRVTLYCNECYVYDPQVETNVFCIKSSGFCKPLCRKEEEEEQLIVNVN